MVVLFSLLTVLLAATPYLDAFEVKALPARRNLSVASFYAASENQDDMAILFENEDDEKEEKEAVAAKPKKPSRWDSLNPTIKSRIIKAGQERAIANKMKREPLMDKKRRVMMFVKKNERQKKRDSRVKRPLGFDERTPLSALVPGMEMQGKVISMTSYGAYVDVGTECDGLLHISQMSTETFVEHPRQVMSPGDEVMVTVRRRCPEKKKLQLTMLPKEIVAAQQVDDSEDRIALTDLQIDDELWGEIKRVTAYGAYVEVGAIVDGWLHFMDHPSWQIGMTPKEFMASGDRIRVWVSDLDHEQKRVKLTANRPTLLPGPRREVTN